MAFPSSPWSKLSLDIVGELHGVPQQNRFLIVCIDLHSKCPEIQQVANIRTPAVTNFLSNLFARWGLPEEHITDNGWQFVSQDFENFLSQLGIKHCKTAFYHSQSTGAVVRCNWVINEGLRVGRARNHPFEQRIRSILANYRATVQATTGKTPSELMIGRSIRMPFDLLRNEPPARKSVHFTDQVKQHV